MINIPRMLFADFYQSFPDNAFRVKIVSEILKMKHVLK